MVLIRTANQQMSVKRAGGIIAFTERLVKERWMRTIDWSRIGGVVAAEIAHSNWRVSCPYCSGAIVIEPGLPFFCPDCCMQANDYQPMFVQMPDEKTRREIERLLVMRADPVRRNWYPHETIADIRHENNRHGIGG